LAEYKKGGSDREIAERLGVSNKSFTDWRRRKRLPAHHHHPRLMPRKREYERTEREVKLLKYYEGVLLKHSRIFEKKTGRPMGFDEISRHMDELHRQNRAVNNYDQEQVRAG